MININDLPTEIFLYLLETLSFVTPNRLDHQHTLDICSRVSHRWHSASSTLLYARPVLKTHWNWRRLLETITSEDNDLTPDHYRWRTYTLGGLIRTLDLSRLWNVDNMEDVDEGGNEGEHESSTAPFSNLGSGLTSTALRTACARCPNLRELSVHSCAQIDPGIVEFLVTHCPRLNMLWLPGCFVRTTLESGAWRVEHDNLRCALRTRGRTGTISNSTSALWSLNPLDRPYRTPPLSRQNSTQPLSRESSVTFILPSGSRLLILIESLDPSPTNPYVVRFIGRDSALGRRLCKVSLDRQRRRKADEHVAREWFRGIAARCEAGENGPYPRAIQQAIAREGATVRVGDLVAHVMYHRKGVAFGRVVCIAPRRESGGRIKMGGESWEAIEHGKPSLDCSSSLDRLWSVFSCSFSRLR